MRNEPFVVVFAGGGSGGHVYPALAVIESLRDALAKLNVPPRLIRMGPSDGYEVLFQQYGVMVSPIVSGKIRQYSSLQNILDLPKFFVGFLQALFKLYMLMPDAIFSKGGTGALPVVIAGWFYRIPIVIHESDATPGRTNVASARFAKKIFVSFAHAASYFNPKKTEVVGTPVRDELLAEKIEKAAAKEALGFNKADPLMLILCGSQGSVRVNEFVLENLGELTKMTQVLHQAGVANLTEVERLSRAVLVDESFRNRYHAVGYLEDDLATALAAADIIISRAGSNTIFEAAASGLPAILIPLPESKNDHQRANAYEFAKSGGAVVIEEANLLPGIFLNQLRAILTDQDVRAKMSAASRAFFVPDAADKIALEILSNLR